MKTTPMRVFDVPPATVEEPRPKPVERAERVQVTGEGDSAKRTARANLTAQGYHVRALNWSPTPAGGHELVAYIEKGI